MNSLHNLVPLSSYQLRMEVFCLGNLTSELCVVGRATVVKVHSSGHMGGSHTLCLAFSCCLLLIGQWSSPHLRFLHQRTAYEMRAGERDKCVCLCTYLCLSVCVSVPPSSCRFSAPDLCPVDLLRAQKFQVFEDMWERGRSSAKSSEEECDKKACCILVNFD